MDKSSRGAAFVVQPGEGQSYWQPVPANGYAEVMVSSRNDPSIAGFSSGVQVIAPGCHIREHQHGTEQELLFFFEGKGTVLVNGEEHRVQPGTTVYAGPGNSHKIMNDGPDDLKMMWVMMPGGLEDFFEQIGRARRLGEDAPAPFARPENIAEIEARTVFTPVDGANGE
ncbi:MAG: cupin domain-containing protein [Alphaproteobacteria bacterium]